MPTTFGGEPKNTKQPKSYLVSLQM
ncbi:hypothetical protein [Staphylococcus aureus]